MSGKYTEFAYLLIESLLSQDNWSVSKESPEVISIKNDNNQLINLNLTPFDADIFNDIADHYFKNVSSLSGLIEVYYTLRQEFKFETDLPWSNTEAYRDSNSDYASEFLKSIFDDVDKKILSDDVALIVNFVKNLDCYTALKCIESLFYSHSDLALLRIAKAKDWFVHFDHVAIRCGSSKNDSAKQVASFLIEEYGYRHPQIKNEQFYLFEDGWSAFPLYKILSNGQVLRIFVDQSESSHPYQIIQHWNEVYGFTAHHLALRLSKIEQGQRIAIPISEISELMTEKGREVLTPAGNYTKGLLSQVFTKPDKNTKIPDKIMNEKRRLYKDLPGMLMNAKLLEIVSRKEMSESLAKRYYELYDIDYNLNNALHSAVYYQYFLPAQAAHVIKSSIEV